MRITNLTSRPISLGDGTILAAAGTDGASKEVQSFSERDRKRLVSRGYVNVEEQVSENPEKKLDLPPAPVAARRKAPAEENSK